MSDPLATMYRDLLRRIDMLERRVGQTEVKEVPLTVSGTFTPAFNGSTTAGVYTYAGTTAGFYRRLNDLVFVNGRIQISAITTPPAGVMRIAGLPFTSNAVGSDDGIISFGYISNFNNAANAVQLLGVIGQSSALIELYECFDNAAAAAVPAANFTNAACDIIFGGFYPVA